MVSRRAHHPLRAPERPLQRHQRLVAGECRRERCLSLTHDGRSSLGYLHSTWSPDSTRIAFVSCEGRKCQTRVQDIFVMSATGGPRRRITWSGDNNSPSWSPDGRWIAYYNARGRPLDLSSSAELFVVRPDGRGRRNVSRANDASSSCPGTKVALVGPRMGGGSPSMRTTPSSSLETRDSARSSSSSGSCVPTELERTHCCDRRPDP